MQQIQEDTPVLPKFTAAMAGLVFSAEALVWEESAHPVIDALHLDGKRCPYCRIEITDEARLQRWYKAERIKCSSPDCGRFYTSLTNTLIHCSTLDPREFYLLNLLLSVDGDPVKIASVLAKKDARRSINKETVKRWKHRLQGSEQPSA